MPDETSAGSRSIRVLDVLDAVGAAEIAMSATDIETATGLPKATVHRLCNLLLDEGYLQRDLTGRGYEPGARFTRIAMQTVANPGQRGERHAILERVARDIGETCNITVPSATTMLYLDRVESAWPLRIQLPPGSNVPLHCTASGKLFLATLPKARRERFIRSLTLDRHAPNTITEPTALMAALADIARNELGTDDEEFIPGLAAIAVPVKGPNGRMLATLATHGPVMRMPLSAALKHTQRLRDAADELARTLI